MICIATPTRDTVQGTFAYDLVNLVKHTPDTQFIVSFGSYIPNNRINLVRQAIDMGASHIMCLDSDMRFPADTIDRLLKHGKDIVGANYRQRTQDVWAANKSGKFIDSTNKKGLEEVDSLGFGCVLIDLNVFTGKLRKIPEPWFAMPYHILDKKLVGEDVYFYTVAKETGFKVWVDHDLTQDIKHTGSKEL